MKGKYLVLDLETTAIKSFKRTANQFDPRNKVIAMALLEQDCDPCVLYNKEGMERKFPDLTGISFLVGHNIKFDLLWLWDDEKFQQWLIDGGRIWDTMLAEYLLTGQESIYPSLDVVSEKYGGELKDSQVKDFFDAGYGAESVPPDLLLPYAEQDVINTEIVLQAQAREAKRLGMMDIILVHMDHLLSICEMEFNGIHFDRTCAEKLRSEYSSKLKESQVNLELFAEKYWGLDTPYNYNSDDHNSAILFGSKIKEVVDEKLLDDDGEYKRYGPTAQKAGQIKTRKTVVMVKPKSFCVIPRFQKPTKKNGVFQTGETILKKIIEAYDDKPPAQFCKLLLEIRGIEKILNTYIYAVKNKGTNKEIEKGLIPLCQQDGKIHHELDAVATATGRLNSKNPNAQNIPGELRTMFSSRYGDDGVILAVDYSQLEVVVQAYLTQCPKMIQDIKDGIDFHCKRLAYMVDKEYDEVKHKCDTDKEWKARRTKAKAVSYAKAYGAHPTTVARTSGMDLELVEKVFEKEDLEYPEIKDYYEDVEDQVRRSSEPRGDLVYIRDKARGGTLTVPGEYRHVGFYQSITGRRYHFKERASWTKYDKVFRYYPTTDMYNFMVQGTAADIVSLQVGRLFRYSLTKRDEFRIINEVHDEVVIDIRRDCLYKRLPEIKDILRDVNKGFKDKLGLDFNVPIEVDANHGPTWRDAK